MFILLAPVLLLFIANKCTNANIYTLVRQEGDKVTDFVNILETLKVMTRIDPSQSLDWQSVAFKKNLIFKINTVIPTKSTNDLHWTNLFLRMMYYSVSDTATLGKNPSAPIRSQT